MNYNLNSGLGQLEAFVASCGIQTVGRILLVMPTSDPNYDKWSQLLGYDPEGELRLFTTLSDAYDAAESNANDVILLSAHSTHSVTGMITWSKNRVHLLGLDGGGRLFQQGAKIELSGAVDAAAVLKVTGVRNSFRNLKIIQSSTHANALNVVQAAGEGNLYENVSMIFGVANNLDLTTSSELLCGEDSGTFIKCSFGTDVLLTSAARSVVTLDAVTGGNADGAKSNYFEDCIFQVMSSEANATLLKLADTAGAKFRNTFIRPIFIAVLNNTNSAAAITNAVASASSFVEGSIQLYLPASFDCTNLCAGTTDNIKTYGPATSAQAGEAGTPA